MSNAESPVGPPAFTRTETITPWFPGLTVEGLTKRELFAAMAMMGCCALGGEQFIDDEQRLARTAISQADTLLAELAKPQGTEPEVDAR